MSMFGFYPFVLLLFPFPPVLLYAAWQLWTPSRSWRRLWGLVAILVGNGVLAVVLIEHGSNFAVAASERLVFFGIFAGLSFVSAGAVGAVTSAIIDERRDRAKQRGCQSCGYDLTGNISGRCPECGAAVLRGRYGANSGHARRRRLRPVLKWVGTLLSALTIALMLMAERWPFQLTYRQFGLQVWGGSINLHRFSSPWLQGGLRWQLDAYDSDNEGFGAWRDWGLGRLFWNPRPTWREFYFEVPLYVVAVSIVAPSFLLWFLDRRRVLPGRCRCGYDLTGNVSGRCPECGAKIESRD